MHARRIACCQIGGTRVNRAKTSGSYFLKCCKQENANEQKITAKDQAKKQNWYPCMMMCWFVLPTIAIGTRFATCFLLILRGMKFWTSRYFGNDTMETRFAKEKCQSLSQKN